MEYPTTVFDLIAEACERVGARVVLVGGFAVNAHGYARNTKDIDFLITEEDYVRLKSVLESKGYKETVRTEVFVKQELSDPLSLPVDLLFTDPRTFDAIYRGGADTAVPGSVFRIPSLLHLIALKLHAIKQGSKDRVWRDLPDIIQLVIANHVDIASVDFKEICRQYGPDGILEKICELVPGGPRGKA